MVGTLENSQIAVKIEHLEMKPNFPKGFQILQEKVPNLLLKNILLRLDARDLWGIEQTDRNWKNYFKKHHIWTHWLNCKFFELFFLNFSNEFSFCTFF